MSDEANGRMTAEQVADAYGVSVDLVNGWASDVKLRREMREEAWAHIRAGLLEHEEALHADTDVPKGRKHAFLAKRAVSATRRHDRAGRLLELGSYLGMVAALAAYALHSDPLFLAASVGLGAFALYRRTWAFVVLNAVWGAIALERMIR